MGSWVQQTVWEIFRFVMAQATGDLSSEIWTLFSSFFAFPVAVTGSALVQRLVRFAVVVSLAYLPAAFGVQVLKQIFDRMDGSARSAPEELIRRVIVAGVAVTGTSTVAWFMLVLADLVHQALASIELRVNLLEIFFGNPNGFTLVMLFLQILFVVGAIVLIVQRAVLTAELTILLITGPIMAAGLIRENGQGLWGVWIRELTSVLVTPLIQFLTTILFIHIFLDPTNVLTIWQQACGLAYLYVLFNTPRWARQLIYQTGTGSGVVGGASNAARMVVLRKLMTKGV
ncbi:MAG TPA: conjugal transfer protein TrbL family protein [Symbiobacteriaceae bacterium]|nr:conjugal transfer protein TrbL family protein [Symbiobacteriaceae bacterium]